MGNGREHFVFLVLQYIMNFIHLTGMEKLDFDHVKENVQHKATFIVLGSWQGFLSSLCLAKVKRAQAQNN